MNESYYPAHASLPVDTLKSVLDRDRYHLWRTSECAAGRHAWKRDDPRSPVPYCNRCGVPKR